MESSNDRTTPVTYWQVAAGSDQREYSREFLDFGIAFFGHGNSDKLIKMLKPGDRIVLKDGITGIRAVGIIDSRDGVCADRKGDASWLMDFDGWELPYFCFVKWHELPESEKIDGLSMGTLKRIESQAIKNRVEAILKSPNFLNIQPEPLDAKPTTDEDILKDVVSCGLGPKIANELTNAIARIRLLANYYYSLPNWKDVREHETRTFLIIPFLIALGWSEQQIKIELGVGNRGRIDVACFNRPYRRLAETDEPNNSDCVLLLESKGFSQGLKYAEGQVKDYARAFPRCATLVVSNGYCYTVYVRPHDGSETYNLAAYLNLRRPTETHPMYANVSGAREAIRYLLPQTYIGKS